MRDDREDLSPKSRIATPQLGDSHVRKAELKKAFNSPGSLPRDFDNADLDGVKSKAAPSSPPLDDDGEIAAPAQVLRSEQAVTP